MDGRGLVFYVYVRERNGQKQFRLEQTTHWCNAQYWLNYCEPMYAGLELVYVSVEFMNMRLDTSYVKNKLLNREVCHA